MKLCIRHKNSVCRHLFPVVALVAGLLICSPVITSATGAGVENQEEIVLVMGKSHVIEAPWPTVRVAVTDPKIADVQVIGPQQILLQAFKPGATDIILWGEDGTDIWQRTIRVRMDVDRFGGKLKDLFPESSLTVSDSDDVLIVRGLLRSTEEAEVLEDCLQKTGFNYVNMTSIAGVQQVQLEVRVAEVSRRAIRAMGINAFHTDDRYFLGARVGSSSGGALVPSIDIGVPSGTVAGDGLDSAFAFGSDVVAGPLVTLFAGFPKTNLEIFMQALAENQYLRLLANPTLVALSGEQADFLAGGEFPIPVVQGSSGNNAVSIEYKQYGVRLLFKPLVLGDGSIRLKTTQEVSELTSTGSVTIQGFQVPALVMRKADTTLELNSGQTFAMAGLLQNTTSATTSRIPGLGDLPVLGPLFRSVRYQQNETELVILVTASLVEPISAGSELPTPGFLHTPPSDWELYTKGRIAGKEIPPIDAQTREWLENLGLDELVGPGAWESFGEMTLPPDAQEEEQVDEAVEAGDATSMIPEEDVVEVQTDAVDEQTDASDTTKVQDDAARTVDRDRPPFKFYHDMHNY